MSEHVDQVDAGTANMLRMSMRTEGVPREEVDGMTDAEVLAAFDEEYPGGASAAVVDVKKDLAAGYYDS